MKLGGTTDTGLATHKILNGYTGLTNGEYVSQVERHIFVEDSKLLVHGMVMTQMSSRKGLKAFGKKTKDGALKDMRQLCDMSCLFPDTLTTFPKMNKSRQ